MAEHINDDLNALNLPSDNDREFGRVEPWPEPVDLAALLDEIASALGEYVYCDQRMLERDALWITSTWLSHHPAIDAFPLLIITAPDKGCGKTRYLELIGELACKPIFAGNITGAAVFRILNERNGPTVLIDEWDSLGGKVKAMMTNLVNNGYRRRSAWTYRAASKDGASSKGLDRYRLWGPKVLCGIGRATPTIMSRAHITNLEKKPSDHRVEAIGAQGRTRFGILNRKLARIVADYYEAYGPAIELATETDRVGNRGGDNWLPLRAVGILAGERWTEIADRLAEMFSSQTDEDPSAGAELLRDLLPAFTESGKEKLTSEHLIRALSEDLEKRWANFNGYGKPITARQLAKLLRPYGVRSRTVAIGDQRLKGYHLEDLWPKVKAYGAPEEEQATDLLGPLLDELEGKGESGDDGGKEDDTSRDDAAPKKPDGDERSPD
ncbi:DUF3631 domain-containing protein [Paraburkholderia sp. USG1]|uniref:DUF3631 domain-containing protein n=1 Tax=Paraburkholderia sp. USG1 TaxID=2952268 RepID=UPI0028643DFC|nr:DUF3631 domain-containing protein [Paraburkholderia sp. USG1]MDR8401709.1 DUF3631 domain-containing protein [Paraburkholderia sp. USG1]